MPVQYESHRFPVRSPETFTLTTKVFSSGLHDEEKRIGVSRCLILKTKKILGDILTKNSAVAAYFAMETKSRMKW